MIPKNQKSSLLSGVSQSSVKNIDGTFHVNLRHYDKTQGQTFDEWDSEHILCGALNTLHGLSSRKLNQQLGKKLTIYGNFPNKTDFKHPKHVPADANWARIHVNGKQVIAGHILGDTFYLVFLDKEHKFFKTELKHT